MSRLVSTVVDRLKPAPWSELSAVGKVLRLANGLALVSSLAMAVSAATASSDWDLHSDSPPPKRKESKSADAEGGSDGA